MVRSGPGLGVLLLSTLLVGGAVAQEWTRFRGPNGSGESEADGIPAQWTEASYNWRIKLPGTGHSSPVLWGEKLFVLSADPDSATRFVQCVAAATGQTLWQREYPSKVHHLHQFNTFASSTPAVDAERVYVAWGTPENITLKALDHDGQEVWNVDLGPWLSQHGFGTSPVVYQDFVYLSISHDAKERDPNEKAGESFIIALDRRTGKEVWRTPRAVDHVTYSVPCIYAPDGGAAELIGCSTGNGMYGLDPLTGRENWSLDVFSMRTVASPVIAGGLIFGSTGSGGGGNYVVAVQPGQGAREVYRIDRQAPYVPTIVTRGDLAFLFFDKGFVSCLEVPTGQIHWQQRVTTGFFGSPVRIRDKVYGIDVLGNVIVLAADRKFQELGRNPLGEPSNSTPAVAGGRLYLRTLSHLISVGGKPL